MSVHRILVTSMGNVKSMNKVGKAVGVNEESGWNETIWRGAAEKFHEDAEYKYKYCMSEKTEEIFASHFVSEAICNYDKDIDEVIYFGTVKSFWSDLYMLYDGSSYEAWKTLFEYEQSKESNQATITATNYENSTAEWARDFGSNLPPDCKEMKLRYQVLPYGHVEKDIKIIYQIFKNTLESAFNEYIDEDEKKKEKEKSSFELIFDLTGAIRPLPVMQMLLINYFKGLKNYDVKLGTMYYAMNVSGLDYTPIINLKEILDLQNLIEGVSEFNTTGSVNQLESYLSDSDGVETQKDIAEFYHIYNWGINCNSKSIISCALEHIEKLLEEANKKAKENPKGISPILDLLTEQNNQLKKDFRMKNDADFQLHLAKWFHDKNQYGSSFATVSEAIRSILVEHFSDTVTGKDKSEQVRKELLFQFGNVNKNNRERSDMNEVQERVYKVIAQTERCRKCMRAYRNVFAHNLSLSDLEYPPEMCGECGFEPNILKAIVKKVKGENGVIDYEDAKIIIRHQSSVLDRVIKCAKNLYKLFDAENPESSYNIAAYKALLKYRAKREKPAAVKKTEKFVLIYDPKLIKKTTECETVTQATEKFIKGWIASRKKKNQTAPGEKDVELIKASSGELRERIKKLVDENKNIKFCYLINSINKCLDASIWAEYCGKAYDEAEKRKLEYYRFIKKPETTVAGKFSFSSEQIFFPQYAVPKEESDFGEK